MQKAYRLLIKIHGECSSVITGIDSAGQLEREIEELNDQVSLSSHSVFLNSQIKSEICVKLLLTSSRNDVDSINKVDKMFGCSDKYHHFLIYKLFV